MNLLKHKTFFTKAEDKAEVVREVDEADACLSADELAKVCPSP